VVHPPYHALHPYRQPFYRIGRSKASVASSCTALICFSWICHSNCHEQIVVVVTDAVEPDIMEPDTVEPDAMDPDAGPEV
jgi:hypothetical protein